MTTTAVTPNTNPLVTIEQEVLTSIHNSLHRIIFAHLGVIVLFLATLGGLGYLGLRSYDKQVERAEALQVQFQQAQQAATQAQKQLTDIIAADSAARAQESAQQEAITLEMAKRAQQAPAPAVTEALKPSAAAAVVVSGLESAYSDVQGFGTPSVGSDKTVVLSLPQAQAAISAKVDLGRFQADLKDETSLYTLEQSKSTSLSNDLKVCQDTEAKDETALVAANKTIAAFDKVAHQSKFRKVLGSIGRNAERVLILAVGFEIGHKL